MSEIKLKPCPFCGGVVETYQLDYGRADHIIRCANKGCIIKPYGANPSFDTAIKAWNTRNPEETQMINELIKENISLYQFIAPLIGLKPFYGTGNKVQVIWAESQEQANNLPLGADIYKYVKEAISKHQPEPQGVDIEGIKQALITVPLNISSSRRYGSNGLRNVDEVIEAIRPYLQTNTTELEKVRDALEKIKTHAAATNNIIERKCKMYEISLKALTIINRMLGKEE